MLVLIIVYDSLIPTSHMLPIPDRESGQMFYEVVPMPGRRLVIFQIKSRRQVICWVYSCTLVQKKLKLFSTQFRCSAAVGWVLMVRQLIYLFPASFRSKTWEQNQIVFFLHFYTLTILMSICRSALIKQC